MEQREALFDLQIDHESGRYLAEIARWGKFLSIVGFIFCGLMVLVGVFAGSMLGSMSNSMEGMQGMNFGGGLFTAIYIIIALLWFLPCLYLYNFASKAQVAIRSNDQVNLNAGLRNLKACFKYMGIFTIILLAFYAIIFLIAIAAGAASM